MDKRTDKHFQARLHFGLTGAMVPLFWSFIAILVLAVITGGLLYWKAKNVVEETADHSNRAMLGQLRELADGRLNEIELLEQQIAMHPKLSRVLNGTDRRTGQDSFSDVEFAADLTRYKSLSRFVADYFIYAPQSGMMVGPGVRTNPQILFDSVYRYEGRTSADWTALLGQKRPYRVIEPAAAVRNDLNQTRSMITYIYSLAAADYGKSNASLLIMVDEEELRHMLEPLAEAAQGHIFVIDPEDRVISASTAEQRNIRFSYEAMPGESGRLEYSENGQTMVLSYSTSAVNGWKYVLAVPRAVFLDQVNSVKQWALVLLCIAAVGGAAASFYLAYRNYIPLRDLVRVVVHGNVRETKRGLNEYELLRTAIDSVRMNETALREKLSRHAPVIRNNFLQRLVRGYVEEGELGSDSLHMMDIHFMSTSFAVVLLDVRQSGESGDGDEREWPFVSFIISNIATELANEAHQGYVTEMERGRMAVLVNFRSDRLEQAEQDLASVMEQLVFVLERRFHLKLALGQSGIVHETGLLGEAFREALRQLAKGSRREAEAAAAIIQAEAGGLQASYDYPLEVEQQLVNLIRSGDEEKTLKLLEALYADHAGSRTASAAYGMFLLHALAGTLLRIVQHMPKADSALRERLLLSAMWTGAAGEQELHSRFQRLREDYLTVCRQWKAGRSDQGELMVKEIRHYVQAHYGDNMLSVGQIADHLGITQPYLSSFFKKATGQNIADYIAAVRVAEAKQLLAGTALTVAQIALRVGYANDIGFIRFFRKTVGITPGVYRSNLESDRSS